MSKPDPKNQKEAPQTPVSDFGTAESWEEARHVAALIGQVPNSFSTCIRFLRTDHEQNKGELSRGTKFYLSRLLKSVSVSAPLYFAAFTFRPTEFQSLGANADSIMKVFKAGELAALLSLVYLYRTVRKGSDAEEWRFIDELVHPQVDICGLLGDVIPAIGLANSVLVGGLRILSQALFISADKKNFITYRRELKKTGMLADIDHELKTFGCTYGQVASILAQPLGLGLGVSQYLAVGFFPAGQTAEPKEATGIRVVGQWLESILKTGKEPQIAHRVEYYPHAKDIENFLVKANEIKKSGSRFKWLIQGKDTATPDTAPGLFAAPSTAPAVAETESPPDAPAISDEDLKKIEE